MKRSRVRSKPEPPLPDRPPLNNDTPRQFSTSHNRDSDASYGTNRTSYSSSLARTVPMNEKAYKDSAFRTINDFLSSHSVPFSLKPPLPSAKDITNTIRFICSCLDWPIENMKLDEDLPDLLKHLNCPFKLNKSALKAPGTPHTWPALLVVIHWLVQIAIYNDHISDSSSLSAATSRHSFLQDNRLLCYTLESYDYYIRGDDNAVDDLDNKFTQELQQDIDAAAEETNKMEKEVLNLENELQAKRSAPSRKEVRESEKQVLEDDIQKFHAIIDGYKSNILAVEKDVERMEKELDVKISENQRICEENEELKKALEAQLFNLRDVERMKREIHALDREISEFEATRNEWEEKSWDLDATLGQKLKELESLSVECNQAIRRLKIGDEMQYKLNHKGSKSADVLGNDYKSTLKPALIAFADDLKKSSMTRLEELISLQQQSKDNQSKLTEKRRHLTEIQAQIDLVESQLNSTREKIQEYTSRCHMEGEKMTKDFAQKMDKLDILERDADDAFRSSSVKLQDVIKQSDEEIQIRARELLALVDSVSKYKEHMESTALNMKKDFSETIEAVANTYKSSLALEFGSISKEAIGVMQEMQKSQK